ncbi:porin [Burkholderia perseverans]|uniref:porin n=1 Tax=Burkholderia perseverans TaxID=2615214 RepID=UPI001FEE2517|nr:porin [Burkholderia perseverans]
MNRRVAFGFAALASIGAQAASAQSSVTLYGIIDAGITYTNNLKGGSGYQATTGNVQGSRWGLMGSEDLGGGNRAVFKLENGFNPDNGALGQGGRLFGRSAYVGLSNNRYGTVTLGRQYNSVQDTLWNEQANGTGALTQYANVVYDTYDLNNSYRTNNAVKYTSPTIAGLTGTVMYAFANTAGAFADNREWSAGLDYVAGPLHLDAAYALNNSPGANTAGAAPSDNYYSLATSIISNVARNQVWGAGGAYTFGATTAAVLYTNSRFDLLTGGSLRFANYEADLTWKLTPSLLLAAAYFYTEQQSSSATAANAHYHQGTVGAEYFLSKTTDLYLNAAYQRANGANAWIDGSTQPSSNNHQIVAVGGIRHKF